MIRQARENNVKIHKWTRSGYPPHVPPLSLFFISDVHKRKISNDLLSSINDKCDLVIVGGDFTEPGVPKLRTEENLAKLVQLGPVLFVNGNNDDEVDQDWLHQLLDSPQVYNLNDRAFTLKQGNKTIRFLGLAQRDYSQEQIDRLFAEDCADFTVVICHYPDVSRFLNGKEINLMLSGHTHGGQIRLGRFGLRSHGGVIKEEGYDKLVSNGYGTTRVSLRLGAKPETHWITLSSE